MTTIKGYFDDSRSQGEAWTVAGYVASNDMWAHFDGLWTAKLAKSGVPYLHMREMQVPKGAYAKWHPHAEHRDELASFFSDLCLVIGFCQLSGFHITVREKDLAQFNLDHGTDLDAYSLAAWALLLQVARTYPGEDVVAMFDRANNVTKRLDRASEHLLSDRRNLDVADTLIAISCPQGWSSQKLKPLQAADFVAWEARKHHNTISRWFEIDDRPDNTTRARYDHLNQWLTEEFGEPYRSRRKSWDELLCRAPHQGGILDYDVLCGIHKSRGGVWLIDDLPN
jgi:hypothetical protein